MKGRHAHARLGGVEESETRKEVGWKTQTEGVGERHERQVSYTLSSVEKHTGGMHMDA